MQQSVIRINHYFILIMAIWSFSACKKDIDASKETVPYKAGPGLYVSGFTASKDSSFSANVWKDDANVFLKGSLALTMAVQGSDVYIGGTSGAKPVYWKNGVMNMLQPYPKTYGYGEVTGMAIAGNDVYVIGFYANGNDPYVYVYWKNGVINILANSIITGIAASGNDIYLSGYIGAKPVYWKNNVSFDLQNFRPYGIAVSGNDIYLYGSAMSGAQNAVYAYWKNGTVTLLGQKDYIKSIFVKNGDVYLAGTDNNLVPNAAGGMVFYGAAYWKNGKVVRFNGNPQRNGIPGEGIEANAIFVDNDNNVYVAGEAYNDAIERIATYWKNGKLVYLTDKFSTTTGIIFIN